MWAGGELGRVGWGEITEIRLLRVSGKDIFNVSSSRQYKREKIVRKAIKSTRCTCFASNYSKTFEFTESGRRPQAVAS